MAVQVGEIRTGGKSARDRTGAGDDQDGRQKHQGRGRYGSGGLGGDRFAGGVWRGSPASEPVPPSENPAPVLSDTGVGELKLGMSVKQAEATGWVGKVNPDSQGEECALYEGRDGIDALYFHRDELIIIAVGPKIRLDKGVGVGDTFAALNAAYGDRINREREMARLYVTAPDAPLPANYRIGIDTETAFRDSKIMEIALQSTEFLCYE